jgi:hypothetical protein
MLPPYPRRSRSSSRSFGPAEAAESTGVIPKHEHLRALAHPLAGPRRPEGDRLALPRLTFPPGGRREVLPDRSNRWRAVKAPPHKVPPTRLRPTQLCPRTECRAPRNPSRRPQSQRCLPSERALHPSCPAPCPCPLPSEHSGTPRRRPEMPHPRSRSAAPTWPAVAVPPSVASVPNVPDRLPR